MNVEITSEFMEARVREKGRLVRRKGARATLGVDLHEGMAGAWITVYDEPGESPKAVLAEVVVPIEVLRAALAVADIGGTDACHDQPPAA